MRSPHNTHSHSSLRSISRITPMLITPMGKLNKVLCYSPCPQSDIFGRSERPPQPAGHIVGNARSLIVYSKHTASITLSTHACRLCQQPIVTDNGLFVSGHVGHCPCWPTGKRGMVNSKEGMVQQVSVAVEQTAAPMLGCFRT